ncbi:hypothetical protein HBA55_24655 [Pseudomaricurvus alkylphenolicus]|uniref:hypothetical protein n=1 Tax=Pseudomaricurvus alkylphenolicus TaxID=1306991 RepID=UPI00142466B4|nr:hypothetical protein [Pseudomaricurvus alkylphenolicus]NIB42821.1 hypothetical protein [Pseudomaricurvus alkylphenolicus]
MSQVLRADQTLRTDIAGWDGKSSADIEKLYLKHNPSAELVDGLLSLMAIPETSKGSSWLLKHHLENGGSLEVQQRAELIKQLLPMDDWQSQLHLLQCLPYVTFPARQKKKVERFLRGCLGSENKFVRTWSYNGFYLLADQFPEYREEAQQFLQMALRDEAASVKARIRNIIKQGAGWLK